MSGSSQTGDGGRAYRRPKRRAPRATPVAAKPVVKVYGSRSRLPVSGQEPPRVTRYERERMGRVA